MGIIESAREVARLVQGIDDVELRRKILEFLKEVQGLVAQNKQLREKLEAKRILTFRHNAYWASGDGPFCSRCWDTQKLQVRLHDITEPDNFEGAQAFFCMNCNSNVVIQSA